MNEAELWEQYADSLDARAKRMQSNVFDTLVMANAILFLGGILALLFT